MTHCWRRCRRRSCAGGRAFLSLVIASTYRYVDSVLVVGDSWLKMPLPNDYAWTTKYSLRCLASEPQSPHLARYLP